MTPAHAETSVSGAIAADTHWTVGEGPYVVSGNVTLQNSAVLTIDPGVTVYMGAGTSVMIQSGAVHALGTAADPVRVLSENSRYGAGAPGDWDQWVFTSGASGSQLNHVVFEHGKGLLVTGCAPVLNYLDLRNNAGAAITVDLAASPSGVGNQANGNALNGIAVPAGDLTGSVTWGLRGIPYVLTGGVLSVGSSPTVTAVTPTSLQQGDTITVSLTGTRLSGLAQATFDRQGLTAEVLTGGTATQASLQVTAADATAIGGSELHVVTDAGEIRLPNALSVVQKQPTIAGFDPTSIYTGQGDSEITVNGRNFTAETLAVVSGVEVATVFESATRLRITVPNQTAPGTLPIHLTSPDPLHPGESLTSNAVSLLVAPAPLTLAPAKVTVPYGFSRSLSVSLPYAAPEGGATVTLVSSVPSVAQAPASVLIPAGQTSATFEVTGLPVVSSAVSVITASKTGLLSAQSEVTVVTPPSLTLSPSTLTLGSGRTSVVTVQASQVAGAGGLTVSLASDTSNATVPSSVVIPEGSNSATFTVTTVSVGSAVITAQAPDFVPGTLAVNVRPLSIVLPATSLVAPGLNRSIPLTLSDPAPEGGLVVSLTSDNTALATVTPTVTVPAGQTSSNFTVTGVAATGATPVHVTASASGYDSGTMSLTVQSIAISIGGGITTASIPVGMRHTYALTLSKPAPSGGVVVNLAMDRPDLATVTPSSIAVAEGQTASATPVAIEAVLVDSVKPKLTASAEALTPAVVTVTVTAKPEFRFSKNSVIAGNGFTTYGPEVYVYRYTGGSSYSPDQPVTVHFTSSDPGRATVADVTIPAGSNGAYAYVTGNALTNGTPVQIDASAEGYSAPATKLGVTVNAPTFTFSGIETSRSPYSARNSISFAASVTGATYPTQYKAAGDIPIDLAITEATPGDVLDVNNAFFSALTGGVNVSQVTFPAGGSSSGSFYVATPGKAGTYRIQATSAVNTSTSDVVQVAVPELKFVPAGNRSALYVGKGLKTYYYGEVRLYRMVNGVEFNGSQALTVTLTSSDPTRATVPATVTIPANNSSVVFQVTGVELTNGTPVTLDATATDYTAPTTKLPVHVVTPTVTFNGLDLNRSPVSARDDLYLYLSVPEAYYGAMSQVTAAVPLTFDLSLVEATPSDIVSFYANSTSTTAITQATVPAGNAYTTVYVGTPTASGSYKVQVASSAVTATSGAVTVSPPDLKFGVTTLSGQKGLYSSVSISRVVNGTAFSGSSAVTVYLTSSDASKASVPASVVIPANNSSVSFNVSGVDLTNGTPVTITALADGYAAPVTPVSVTVGALTSCYLNGVDSNRSTASARDSFSVYCNGRVAAVDIPFTLSFSNVNPAGIVGTFYSAATGETAVEQIVLHKDAGSSDTAYVGIPSGNGSYTVQASAAGYQTLAGVSTTVATPTLYFGLASGSRLFLGAGMQSNVNELRVYRAVNGQSIAGPDPVTVTVACSSPAICTGPATVTIPANSASVNFVMQGVGVGSTTLTGSAVGYNAPADLGVDTVAPKLNLSGLNTSTKVGAVDEFYVYATVPGAYYGGQTMLNATTVDLVSSSPSVASVPAGTTISAGQNTSTANLTGLSAGTTTVTASGTGLSPVTSGTITITP